MSLLSNPRHLVQVQLRELVDVARGRTALQNVGGLLPVRCNVQPLSSADRLVYGGATADTMRSITAVTWPGDLNSLVIFDGIEWDTYGDPQFFKMSPRTAHWEIRIVKEKPHVDGV
jgi:hypothetical protein